MAIGTAGWEIGPVTALLRYAESDRRAKRHGEISPLDCHLITLRQVRLSRPRQEFPSLLAARALCPQCSAAPDSITWEACASVLGTVVLCFCAT